MEKKMLLEITQQIIEILNKTLTTVDDASLDDKESQAVRDTCNKLGLKIYSELPEGTNLWEVDRLGITFDSLWRLYKHNALR